MFRAHILICGGIDAIRCKIFASTLNETTLDWFNNLLEHNVTSFDEIFKMFIDHFAANKPKLVNVGYMFDLKQERGETLKSFLGCFCEMSMQVSPPNVGNFVVAFIKGLRVRHFGKSLVERKSENMTEVRMRARSHIKPEVMMKKRENERFWRRDIIDNKNELEKAMLEKKRKT